MLPAFATTDDYEIRVGTLAADDVIRAQAALDDASALIRAEANTTWTTDGEFDEDVPDILLFITVAAARRFMESDPTVQSESIGDASVTYTNQSAGVYLTATERRLIRRAAGLGGAMGVVTMEADTPGWTGDVIAVTGSDEPLPFTYSPLRP